MCALLQSLQSLQSLLRFRVFRVFNHCCVSGYFCALCRSRASAKCQCMDFRVAQRSMIRTHTPYILQRARTHTHTHTISRERERAHTIYFTGEETMHKTFLCAHTHRIYFAESARTPHILQERRHCTKHSYAHIHTAIIHRKYSMQSACAAPSSITAAFPLQLRRSKAHANVRAWTHFLRSDR